MLPDDHLEPIYVSTYCNFAHRLSDGKPIEHECRVIPPEALEAEMRDDFPEAQRILSHTPPAWQRGVKRREAKRGKRP